MSSKSQIFDNGYSVLELVAVLAVLSTLASLTLPNVLKILDFNNVDEVKALLNSAAADCLQQSRLESSPILHTDIVDEAKIKTLGYSLDPTSEPEAESANTGAKCSFLLLNPTNASDTIRYPIGFSVFQGELTKFANRPSTDEASIQSCDNWAGANCQANSSDAQKTIANSNTTNAIAQQQCEENYKSWTPSATGKSESNRWNSATNSCDKTIYAYNSKVVGHDKCSQRLAEEKASKTNTTDPNGTQLQGDCPGQIFWFYEGTNLGSQEAWSRRKSEGEEQDCREKREDARKNNGSDNNICYLPQEGPGDCGKMTYLHGKAYVELEFFLDQKKLSLTEFKFEDLTCENLENP